MSITTKTNASTPATQTVALAAGRSRQKRRSDDQRIAGMPTRGIAIYVRSDRTDELADQIDRCVPYAKSMCAPFVQIYKDYKVTGTTIQGGPELQRLLGDAAKGFFDLVIAVDAERFSEHPQRMCEISETLREREIKVFNADGVRLKFGEDYVRPTAGDVTAAGRRSAVQEGKVLGRRAYGYVVGAEPGSTLIHPERAKHIIELFTRVAEGETLASIASSICIAIPSVQELGDAGANDPRANKPWSATVVRQIIRNPIYRGRLLVGGRLASVGKDQPAVDVPAPHLRIVTDALWFKANRSLRSRGRLRNQPI